MTGRDSGTMWNRCDVCGRFIALSDFDRGNARRALVTPDSHFSREEYETLCGRHNVKENHA